MALASFLSAVDLAAAHLTALTSQLILSETLNALRAVLSGVMSLALAVGLGSMLVVVFANDRAFMVALTVREVYCLVVRLVVLSESGSEGGHFKGVGVSSGEFAVLIEFQDEDSLVFG